MTEPRQHTYTEDELLARLREGDEWMLGTLFNRHFGTLMIFAQRYVPFEVAQDILSETFVKFWHQRDQFFSEASVYQWLKVSVRNAAINQLRNIRKTELKEPGSLEKSELSFEEDFYEAAVESGLFRRIVDEIALLPPQQQRIIRMFFVQGKDNAAIASELGISVQAVKNQKVNALKVLRKTFSAEDLGWIVLAFMASVK